MKANKRRNEYPTSDQERELLALRGAGVIRTPKYRDVRPDRVVSVGELDRGILSCTTCGNTDELVRAALWLDRYGWNPAVMGGKLVY